MEKADFVGRGISSRTAEIRSGLKQHVGHWDWKWSIVEASRATDYKVSSTQSRRHEIGYVTSGSPAPFLKKNIALAYVPAQEISSHGHGTQSRNPGTRSEGRSGADTVLQEAEKELSVTI